MQRYFLQYHNPHIQLKSGHQTLNCCCNARRGAAKVSLRAVTTRRKSGFKYDDASSGLVNKVSTSFKPIPLVAPTTKAICCSVLMIEDIVLLFFFLEPLLTKTYVRRGGEVKANSKDYTAADTKVHCLFTSSTLSVMRLHDVLLAPMYCASKAQLNHLVKHYALLWPHLCLNLIHPGYIKTKMAPNGVGTTEESAEGMLKTIGAESAIPTACQQQLLWYNGDKTEF